MSDTWTTLRGGSKPALSRACPESCRRIEGPVLSLVEGSKRACPEKPEGVPPRSGARRFHTRRRSPRSGQAQRISSTERSGRTACARGRVPQQGAPSHRPPWTEAVWRTSRSSRSGRGTEMRRAIQSPRWRQGKSSHTGSVERGAARGLFGRERRNRWSVSRQSIRPTRGGAVACGAGLTEIAARHDLPSGRDRVETRQAMPG